MDKMKRMVLDGVQDHMVLHIAEKETTKDMWDAIVKLYWDPLENHKIILKEKLENTKMLEGEGMTPYLTRILNVCDEIVVVNEKHDDKELV